MTVCQAVLGTIDSLQRTLSLSTTPQVKGPGDSSLKGQAEAAPNPVHGARLCDGERQRIGGSVGFSISRGGTPALSSRPVLQIQKPA